MYFTRTQLENFEDQTLAPYGLHSKNSRGREHPEREREYRTAFQRDQRSDFTYHGIPPFGI